MDLLFSMKDSYTKKPNKCAVKKEEAAALKKGWSSKFKTSGQVVRHDGLHHILHKLFYLLVLKCWTSLFYDQFIFLILTARQ